MSVAWGRVEAVCFDMDGTLVDSDAAWLRATRAAFARHGVELTDALYAETLGLDNTGGVKAVLRHFPDRGLDPADLVLDLEDAIQAEFRRGIEPMPGAGELLARWHARWPLALVSTSSENLIDCALDGLGWRRHFAFRLSSEQVGPSKPDPAVYREAARRLGKAPEACLAVEDSLNGVRSAHSAGMQVAALSSDPAMIAKLAPFVCAVVSRLTLLA